MGASKPAVPLPLALHSALARNDSLAGLQARLTQSQARLDAVRAVMPATLARELRAGPLDDEGWSVLVSNAAVAAKLRHLLPSMAQALKAAGHRELAIRVRISGP
jgi:hypothetical protein